MTHRICLRVLGTDFQIQTESVLASEQLHRLWTPFVTVPADGALSLECTSPVRTSADINRLSVDGYQGFAAHAGVAALGDRVLAMPAVSGAGKTNMTAACVASGWDYVSDEALCIEYGDAAVTAYPKPLALSSWSAAAVGLARTIEHAEALDFNDGDEVLVTAADLGGGIAQSPLRLTDIVRLEREPGSSASFRPLHRADAVPLLLGLSFNHYRSPAKAFALVTGLARECQVWSLTYSHPLTAMAMMAEAIG